MVKKQSYSEARIHKDKAYDGVFYFAVKTTGIFCRPSCPSPQAKEENVEYYTTVYDALNRGYRPCLRCRPDIKVDYYNGNVDGADLVQKALEYIYDGFLVERSLADLAGVLAVSQRHMRKLFVANMGMPPVKVASFHKALFARKLLSNSDMSITDIAYASGFGSIRQFNQVMKDIHGVSPSELRKRLRGSQPGAQERTLQEPEVFSGLISIDLHEDQKQLFKKFMEKSERKAAGRKTIGKRANSRMESSRKTSKKEVFEGEASRYYGTYSILDKGKPIPCAYSLFLSEDTDTLKLEIEHKDLKRVMEIYNHVRKMLLRQD